VDVAGFGQRYMESLVIGNVETFQGLLLAIAKLVQIVCCLQL